VKFLAVPPPGAGPKRFLAAPYQSRGSRSKSPLRGCGGLFVLWAEKVSVLDTLPLGSLRRADLSYVPRRQPPCPRAVSISRPLRHCAISLMQ
jgi:hypothetical protein